MGFILISGNKDNYPILEFGKGDIVPEKTKENAQFTAEKFIGDAGCKLDSVKYLYLGATFYYGQYTFENSLQNVKQDGRDIWPLLTGSKTAHNDFPIYWKIAQYYAVREGKWKLLLNRKRGFTLLPVRLMSFPGRRRSRIFTVLMPLLLLPLTSKSPVSLNNMTIYVR